LFSWDQSQLAVDQCSIVAKPCHQTLIKLAQLIKSKQTYYYLTFVDNSKNKHQIIFDKDLALFCFLLTNIFLLINIENIWSWFENIICL